MRRKIIEIVATRCHILRLKCTKFDFDWGSAPDSAGGAYIQRSSRPPSWILGVLLLREGGEGKGRKGEGEGEGKEKGKRERARGEEGRGKAPIKFSQPPSWEVLEICLVTSHIGRYIVFFTLLAYTFGMDRY